ncbi:MAG: helix-turn-helix transcriptional regulator [Pseudomonadota bacterium]
MNKPIDFQTINGPDGKPAYVVLPYADFVERYAQDRDLIPHAVVEAAVDGASITKAWRLHLDLTQDAVAQRMGVTQSAYAQLESSAKLRKSSRERIAAALGIMPGQLDL